MPKIYEYLGLIIFFYSNEHEPIHVHAKYGRQESKAEFIISNGRILEINIYKEKGRIPLKGKNLKNFKKFLDVYNERIVQKWIDYFVYHRKVELEKIEKKLR